LSNIYLHVFDNGNNNFYYRPFYMAISRKVFLAYAKSINTITKRKFFQEKLFLNSS